MLRLNPCASRLVRLRAHARAPASARATSVVSCVAQAEAATWDWVDSCVIGMGKVSRRIAGMCPPPSHDSSVRRGVASESSWCHRQPLLTRLVPQACAPLLRRCEPSQDLHCGVLSQTLLACRSFSAMFAQSWLSLFRASRAGALPRPRKARCW